MIDIDGSAGEGGGQVLRTALALSLATGRAFRIEGIRAGRAKPGLLRQHLTAVQAATEIGRARSTGAELGSRSLRFEPGPVAGGDFRFAIGSAGSTTLVLQAVLPALITAPAPSRLTLEGGTHNPLAPPYDFLAGAFLPLLGRCGARVETRLDRPGFYPAGGGRFEATVEPVSRLGRLELRERGAVRALRARALVANLPREIGERELRSLRAALGSEIGGVPVTAVVEELTGSAGPGNVLLVEIECEHATEVVTAFGERGVPAEEVGRRAGAEARRYLAAGVPVGEHLADQLLLPLALAGEGSFRTLALSSHASTNLEIIRRFLPVDFIVTDEGADRVLVEARGRTP